MERIPYSPCQNCLGTVTTPTNACRCVVMGHYIQLTVPKGGIIFVKLVNILFPQIHQVHQVRQISLLYKRLGPVSTQENKHRIGLDFFPSCIIRTAGPKRLKLF